MMKNSRILDLLLLLILLALASWSCQPSRIPTSPAVAPPLSTPAIPSPPNPQSTTSPGDAVWLKHGLQMHLQWIRSGAGLKEDTLKVSLRNTTARTAFIPGTFCQEGGQTDWWSHAVRVRVRGGSKSWRLGPSYGMRELHEHPSYPMTIQPGQVLHWEFRLGQLDQNSDGEGSDAGWEQANRVLRLQVTCELPHPGYTVFSNPITLEERAAVVE